MCNSATGKYFTVKGTLSCNNGSVMYLITCHIIVFKERSLIHKTDVNTGKQKIMMQLKTFQNAALLKVNLIAFEVHLIKPVNVNGKLSEQKL